MPDNGIRILTLNLWGQSGAWADRRSVLIDGLRSLKPDLVAFQEVVLTDEYDQARDLIGPEFHITQQTHREDDGRGICIASRWPLGNIHEIDLNVTPRTADFACGTLVAEILTPDPIGRLLFVNHLPNWQLDFELERELQAVHAARFIENMFSERETHVILVGDFDADPNAASIRFWSGRQSLGGMSVCYRDAWESQHPGEDGHTFTPRNALMNNWDWPFRRIDYIFVRCGRHGGPTLEIASCALAFDQPINGVWASDHIGVTAELVIPE